MGALFNLARMTTATTGTSTITLGSAVSGFLTFAQAGVADGQTVSYGIADGANSEVGQGVYTASGTTLTRTVSQSTNSNAAISLSGNAQVFVTALAADIAPLVSPAFTGTPTSPTPSTADNSTNIATTAYVQANLGSYLPLTGGTLTGNLNMTSGSFYRYNGVNLAYIVPLATGDSIFFGEAGNTTMTGINNIGIGLGAAAAITLAAHTIAIGRSSCAAVVSNGFNIGIGVNALTIEASGSTNTAIGYQIFKNQNGASSNVGMGYNTGFDVTTGGTNTFIGYNTGRGVTTGTGNTVVGASISGLAAGLTGAIVLGSSGTVRYDYGSTTASVHTFSGGNVNIPTASIYQHNAKNLAFSVPNASGDNVFFGQAGNTTATGAANSSLGATSSHALTSANNNTVVGYNALNTETSGSQNTAIGRGALNVQNGGGSNTALGYLAGSGVTTGSSNLLVGYNAAPGLSTGSNNTIIGTTPSLAAATANTIILGQNSTIRYDWNYTTASIHTFSGGPVRLTTGMTVATLPSGGPTGATAYVTDGAASLAWGATVTGGGSTPYLVWYNGTAWTVVGK